MRRIRRNINLLALLNSPRLPNLSQKQTTITIKPRLKGRPNSRSGTLAHIASSLVEMLHIARLVQHIRTGVPQNIRRQNHAGVNRETADLGRVAPFDRVAHPDVGGFRVPVGCQGVVGAFGEVQVVEADLAEAVAGAGEGDDSAWRVGGCGVGEGGLEEAEEQEVAEVVAA